MNDFLFMGPAIQAISEGRVFQRIFALILRVVGVLTLLFLAYTWIRMWSLVFHLGSFFAVVGGIIFQGIFIIGAYMVLHAIFIRAGTLAKLPEGDFVVIPIMSVLLRLAGEIYASILATVAVGGCILAWFAGDRAMYLLSTVSGGMPLPTGSGFVGGLMLLIVGICAAFASLVIFYFLAELLVIFADIALNSRVTSRVAEQYEKSPIQEAAA